MFEYGRRKMITNTTKEKEYSKADIEKAKQFLFSANRYDEMLRLKELELDYLMNIAQGLCSPTYALGTRINAGFINKENTICAIITLKQRIKDDIDNLVEAYTRVKSAIGEVQDKEHRMLLEMRYLTYKTWEEIALDMNYSLRHIVRIHEKALSSLCETEFYRRNIE